MTDYATIANMVLVVAASVGVTASVAFGIFKRKFHDIRDVIDNLDNAIQAGQVTSAEVTDIMKDLKDLVH